MLKVKAGDLAEALMAAKPKRMPKRPKPVTVSLEHEFVAGALAVIEAKHAAFAKSLPASGNWSGPVQLDALLLLRLVSTWPPETELEMEPEPAALGVRSGKSISRVARTDCGGTPAIKRTAVKPDKRHKGKVEVPPDPTEKRVELADTWLFSARVPMPQHRKTNKY